MPHPYLYFSKANIEAYRQKMQNDEKAKQKYLDTVKDVEDILKEPFVTEAEANGRTSLHANFWSLGAQANKMATALGTKYVVENDVRCAEKLKALIVHFTGFERWYAESYKKRTPIPWHSDLCSTRMTFAIGTVYDLIYDYLTPDERNILAEKIYELGVKPALSDWALPETRIHAVDSMGHNWWAVCIAESAACLLALKDNLPQVDVTAALDCVNRALAAYFTYSGNTLFNKFPNYDRQGLFYESIGYFEYGTGTCLQYLWCYERLFGENRVLREALPKKMGDALMSFAYPYLKDGKTAYGFMNFGDAAYDDEHTFLAKYLVKNGLDTSAVRCLINGRSTDLWEDIQGYQNDFPGSSTDDLGKTAVFDSGYVLTRDSWAPDSTLLAIKSGYCWNHSHNDCGTFNICYKGSPFIIDSGCCGYDDPLYHAYYCQDAAHNVVTVGEKGRRHEELYRGTKFLGKVVEVREGRDFLFSLTDGTGPMAHLCSRLYRSFFWLDDELLVIIDDIYCHEENTAEFTLHYEGTVTEKDGGYVIQDGERFAVLKNFVPGEMIYSQKTGYAPGHPETEKPYLQLQTKEKARKHLLIHTLLLDKNNDVEITHMEGKNAEGIKIVKGDKEREIWYNHMADGHVMHDNSNNVIAGYDTDAYMLFITRDKKEDTEEVMSVSASYLRKNNRVLFADFIKSTGLYK